MQQGTFKIKINNTEYGIDCHLDHFCLPEKNDDGKQIAIPLNRFRYKDDAWYILWDKKADWYFDITGAAQRLPLTVEWVKVIIMEQAAECKERIDLIILLYETIDRVRNPKEEGDLKKPQLALKKNISLFLARNDGAK